MRKKISKITVYFFSILGIVFLGLFIFLNIVKNKIYHKEVVNNYIESNKNVVNIFYSKIFRKPLFKTKYYSEVYRRKNLEEIQKKITDQINKEYSELDYSFRTPYIKLNPYGTTPLSALLKFQTEKKTKLTMTIKGREKEEDLVYNFSNYTTDHEYPIIGLYPNYENKIELKIIDEKGNEKVKNIKIKTKPLSYEKVSLYFVKNKKDNKNNYYFATGNYTAIYDEYGNLRYTLDEPLADWSYKISRDRLIIEEGINLYEFDLLGRLIHRYNLDGYSSYRHGIFEMPNGNILEIGTKQGTTKIENGKKVVTGNDMLFEIERNTGQIVKEWDLGRILDTNRYIALKSSYDWAHFNSAQYVKEDNSLVCSVKYFGMLKMDYNTGDLKWIFGPNIAFNGTTGRDGKGPSLENKILKATDKNGNILPEDYQTGKEFSEEFKWPYNNHDARYIGDNLYTIFDNNGGLREKRIKQELNSRANLYEVKDGKVRMLWSQKLPAHSILGSNMILDRNTNDVYIYMSRIENKDMTRAYGKLLRYNKENGDLLFEADIYINPTKTNVKEDYKDYQYKVVPIELSKEISKMK